MKLCLFQELQNVKEEFMQQSHEFLSLKEIHEVNIDEFCSLTNYKWQLLIIGAFIIMFNKLCQFYAKLC